MSSSRACRRPPESSESRSVTSLGEVMCGPPLVDPVERAPIHAFRDNRGWAGLAQLSMTIESGWTCWPSLDEPLAGSPERCWSVLLPGPSSGRLHAHAQRLPDLRHVPVNPMRVTLAAGQSAVVVFVGTTGEQYGDGGRDRQASRLPVGREPFPLRTSPIGRLSDQYRRRAFARDSHRWRRPTDRDSATTGIDDRVRRSRCVSRL